MLTRKSLLTFGPALLCLGFVGRVRAQVGSGQTPPGPPQPSAATNPNSSRSQVYNGHSALGANSRIGISFLYVIQMISSSQVLGSFGS